MRRIARCSYRRAAARGGTLDEIKYKHRQPDIVPIATRADDCLPQRASLSYDDIAQRRFKQLAKWHRQMKPDANIDSTRGNRNQAINFRKASS